MTLKSTPEPIAIVGIACMFPEAPNLETFWNNILNGVDAVGEPVPDWDPARYLESSRIEGSEGGYLGDLYRFDPRNFGIMPNSIDGGEPDQFLALKVSSDALDDAGYLGPDRDHRDTGIVIGHSTYLHRGQGNLIQHNIVIDQTIDILRGALPDLAEDRIAEVRELLTSKLPQFNADVAPSLVPNVMTGRIANRLNLRGPNYLVDAACSSSLIAVGAAIDELRSGRSRMMIAGGVNASLPAEVTVIFTLLGALSRRGKVRPFESGSDGTLLGEGLGSVVLKRVSDAEADGDKIYALIHGVAQASDGRGHGLLAPSLEGEILAIRRAYETTGIEPETISLIEAHGTGIPLGDQTEISALGSVFGEREGRFGRVAIGSVKSMISHCIPAAGIAGLIKTALALHHRVLPPTLCEKVNPDLGIEGSCLYVNTETRPWIASPGSPRRAGVDAFGFGGINTHAILEQAPESAVAPARLSDWPAELCVLSAGDPEALIAGIRALESTLPSVGARLRDVAAALLERSSDAPCRLAIVAEDIPRLIAKLEKARARIEKSPQKSWALRNGSCYASAPNEGSLAFLFPGEGSQYGGMMGELAMHFDEVRSWFDFWRGLYPEMAGGGRTDVLFPPAAELTDRLREELETELQAAETGSEAVFMGGQAMYALLDSIGLRPDAMLGHSSGESSALVASGAFPSDDPSKLTGMVRDLNARYRSLVDRGDVATGALLAVGAVDRNVLDAELADRSGLHVAMENCANQVILFGPPDEIKSLDEALARSGAIAMQLPFDRGYHTPMFAEVGEEFRRYYDEVELSRPSVPLYSCASADVFPDDPDEVRALAARQWSTTVRFRETIERMYADGVRTFVEVGPSGNLTSFVKDVLGRRPYVALATNERRKGDLEQLLSTVGRLHVEGYDVDLEKLFSARGPRPLDLDAPAVAAPAGMRLHNTMPMLRLDDSDREQLRQILKVEIDPAPVIQSEPLPTEPQFVAGDSQLQDQVDAEVFGGYFDLMRDFLKQQSALLGEITAGMDGEEAGELLRQEVPQEVPQKAPQEEALAPFLTALLEVDETHLLAECQLSLRDDLFLQHHVLSGPVSAADPDLLGLSCVPLMVSLEIMAEASALLAGSRAVHRICDVQAFDWIALDEGATCLRVHAERIAGPTASIRASLIDASDRVVVTAEFGFSAETVIQAVAPLENPRGFFLDNSQLYTTGMFHGPLFQSVRNVQACADEGIDAELSRVPLMGFFREAEPVAMILNPVLLDALGQIAAYWIANRIGLDFNCFPSTIERIELYTLPPDDLPGLRVHARQDGRGSSLEDMAAPRSWDFEVVDGSGSPVLRVSNLVNVFFNVPPSFAACRRDPLTGILGGPETALGAAATLVWRLEHFSPELLAQSSRIFMRTLAHVVLSADERIEWHALADATPARQRKWLLGRACLKEAVRVWIERRSGRAIHPADVVIRHDDLGAPWVDGWWVDELAPRPSVSLGHDAGAEIAAVADPGLPIGVDVERLGRVAQPELVAGSFTEAERALIAPFKGDVFEDWVLRIWCAKEAASKFFGTGLQGDPAAFEVFFRSHEGRQAIVRCTQGEVEVAIDRMGQSIVALAES